MLSVLSPIFKLERLTCHARQAERRHCVCPACGEFRQMRIEWHDLVFCINYGLQMYFERLRGRRDDFPAFA